MLLCFSLIQCCAPARQIELTNQDGEAISIPAEDSAALMEGMMLHRQGLACVARAGAGVGAAVASAAAVAAAARGRETRSAQKKKARHPPLPPQGGKSPSVAEMPATTSTPTPTTTTATTTTNATTATTNRDSVGKNAKGSLDDGADKEALECSGGARSDREEGRTQGAPEEKGEGRVAEHGGDMQVADDAEDLGALSVEGPEEGTAAKSVAKGKGRPKPGERARCHVDF